MQRTRTQARLQVKDPLTDKLKLSASGLTGVWAEQNTREAIFAALKRKETYATSGTFITPRFFGGWLSRLPHADARLGAHGVRGGVPMGGDLPAIPGRPRYRRSPSRRSRIRSPAISTAFRSSKAGSMPRASRTRRSSTSPRRTIASRIPHGQGPPVGNTVDVKTASYTNDIGDPELCRRVDRS